MVSRRPSYDCGMLTDRAAPELCVLLLYTFRFVDPVTGRWVRARYRAERREIEQRAYPQAPQTGKLLALLHVSRSLTKHVDSVAGSLNLDAVLLRDRLHLGGEALLPRSTGEVVVRIRLPR